MPLPLDLNGPRTQDFEPWPDHWIDRGIIARFDSIVARHADDTALDDGAHRLSYAALSTIARDLAARIDAACEPGAIGILQSHSAAFWVAILACVGAGRTYVGLDLHHPASRNAEILKDAGVAAVIAPPGFDPDAQVIPAGLPRLSWDLAAPPDSAPAWPCPAAPGADVPAAVLYTSGSTGRPKGVANNQQALLQRVAQYVNACHLHAGDRMLTLSSPCTIAGTREGLTALLTGATLHVIDTQHAGLGTIIRCIREARITALNAVPSMLRALMNGPGAADALRSLRTIRVGGEVVFWTDIALFRSVLPADCFIQIGYSATEATGTQWFVPRDATPGGPFVPVGYVLPGNAAAVVDDDDQPVPPGDTGELVLRSRYLALGTWQHGRCIPGSMRPDPEQPGARVLRTGDLVHIEADGLCTVTGRKDRQVKISGVRVEPSEVEAALRALPDVADAAVIARRSGKATTLGAFVVPRATRRDLGAAEIRDTLRAQLPPAMRPARVHVIGSLPRLPSAKLDTRALQALDQEPAGDGAAAAAGDEHPAERPDSASPGSVIQAVQHGWRAVLGRRALDRDLSFEAAGGDSLKMLQFVLWLETLLDRRLPLDLFTSDMHIRDAVVAIEHAPRKQDQSEGDERPTVFLFPGLGGDEPRLAQFRAALQDRIRFVVITYLDWADMVRRGRRFDALVEVAVSQITAAQPGGRLLLAGYSFGGDVAFAAARRLVTLGRSVSFLGILDTDAEKLADDAAAERAASMRDQGRNLRQDMAHDRWHAGAGVVLSKCARDVVGLERLLRHSRLWRPLLPTRTAFTFDRRTRLVLQLLARRQWYRAGGHGSLAVPTALFRTDAHAADATPDLGWGARSSDLTVVSVNGNHWTMLDPPHRADLCDRFAEAVHRATVRGDAVART